MPSTSFVIAALVAGFGATATEPAKRPRMPPTQVKIPGYDAARPLLSNPQLSLDGQRIYVARLPRPGSPVSQGLDVQVISLSPGSKPETIHFPAPVNGGPVRLLLSRSDKYLAVLTAGELWLDALGETGAPHRLYPPAEGDAPLGPALSQASFSTESTWILVQSPAGWGRVSVKGEYGSVPLHPIDLSTGSMDMSSDGMHAAFVKPQQGEGYLNGSQVLAANISTAFTQALDIEHLYSEVLFLPDGHLLGKETGGQLWVLRPKGRLAYFKPPAGPRGATIDGYAINFAATKLAWVLTSGRAGKSPRAELWIAGAPPTPEPPNSEKPDAE